VNAMNLLALMFAAPQAAQSATQMDSQVLPDGEQFKLLLEQGLLAMPTAMGETSATGTTELPTIDKQLLAALSAGLTTGETAEATAAAALVTDNELATAGTDSATGLLPLLTTMADTLEALAEQLRQALEAILPTSSDDSGATTTAGNATATLASLEEAVGSLRQALGITADTGATVLTGDGQSTDWLTTQLPRAWRAAIRSLNALANGQAELTASSLAPAEAPLETGLPWSVRGTAITASTQLFPVSTDQAGQAALAATGSSDQLPASIQWFQTAGIVSLNPQPAVESTDKTLANATDLTATTTTSAEPLTTQINLSDGTVIELNLAAARPPATLNIQQYNVTVTSAEEPDVTWQAQLTIQRLDTAALPLAGEEALPTAAPAAFRPAGLDLTQLLPQQTLATGLAATQLVAADQSAPVLTATTDLAQAITSLLDPAVTAQLEQTALAATLDPQSADGVVKTVVDPQVAATVNQIPSILTKEQQALGAKAVALINTTTAETLANAEQLSSGQSNAAADWAADEVLENLLARTGQPVPTVATDAKGKVQLGSDTATAVTLDTAMLNPTIVTSPQTASPQLMQFTGNTFEVSQYTGLQYLELAAQIQEQVAQARSVGNGLYNAHLNLNPPSLGKMFVNISVRGEAVALQIAVASTVPREQLKDSLDALRQSLEDSGLYVVELMVVEVDGDEGQSSQQQTSSQDEGSAEDTADQAVKATPVLNETARSVPAIGLAD